MYVNPFIAGILSVIIVEILFVFVYAVTHGARVERIEYKISKEDLKKVEEMLKEKEDESNHYKN